jgi:hypothetical protein
MNTNTPPNPKKQEVSIQEQLDELKAQVQAMQEHLGLTKPKRRAGFPFKPAKSGLVQYWSGKDAPQEGRGVPKERK